MVRRLDMDKTLGIEQLFASDPASTATMTNVVSGHLSDIELVAHRFEVVDLLPSQKFRGVSGPLDVVQRWQPIRALLVASGDAATAGVVRKLQVARA